MKFERHFLKAISPNTVRDLIAQYLDQLGFAELAIDDEITKMNLGGLDLNSKRLLKLEFSVERKPEVNLTVINAI